MRESRPSFRQRMTLRIKKVLGMNVFLCDSCKWNWRSACRRPERPNATWCDEYARKGR